MGQGIMPSAPPYRLAAEVTGQGPDLLLIHGGAGSRNHWLRNIDALSAYFRVHAVDLPGYGESPDLAGNFGAEAYIDLLHDALDGLALSSQRLNVVGFSFGSAVAAALAVKLDTRIDKLSLIGPAGFGLAPRRVLDLRNLRSLDSGSAEYKEAIRHNLSQMMLWSAAAIDDEAIGLHHENIMRTRFDSRKVSQRPTMLGDLARLRCPTQILYGEHDRLAVPSVAERVAMCRQAMPAARIEIIAAAGHWAQFENAPDTNRALLDFLRGGVSQV
jgi:2-hydroxy-6-oxonona-2,4-dienedioate hydrolase